MKTIIRQNERSWAIELISKINSIADKNDLIIKKAGGEPTISTAKGNTMFPDVILYGNIEQNIILQGWEIKMPDIPIENETFIKDSQRKALALGLNSCLIWNFTYAVLYEKNSDNKFKIIKQWNNTNHIKTRSDVKTYRSDWEKLLESIIFEINDYFVSGEFHNASLGDIISESTITMIINRNKDIVAKKLKSTAIHDTIMEAYIDNWWNNISIEYELDEHNKYTAYAKIIILNWTNRFIFAHLIKNRQNGALIINTVTTNSTPTNVNDLFKEITERCDFYNIFSAIKYNECIPEFTWNDFLELSFFLKNNGINQLDQIALQNILENSVATSKREINGQFTTPPQLAKMLVRLSIKDWTDMVIDCCCGTGTISKAAIEKKKEYLSAKESVESVWACDKYQYPLQIANISMADTDTINIPNRLFQHNALTLSTGEKISIINPETGKEMILDLPKFGTVVSNLPFVPFEKIQSDDKSIIFNNPQISILNGRSDLYCYITLKIADIIKPGGTLGIITSNSWLGTNTGIDFINVIKTKYNIKQVHISGKGRWFNNADVVTTILVLEKKKDKNETNSDTDFWLWKKSLNDLSMDIVSENNLINSALLSIELDSNTAKLSKYSQNQIENILSLNVSYNALFHEVDWLINFKSKIIQIGTVFEVFRGSRRGWDPLFYPQKGEHHIEEKYLELVHIEKI